jgi:hypothetical protein
MTAIRDEAGLMPPTDEVRAALARNVREAERLKKLLRILEQRDEDDLARPLSLTREVARP